MIEFRDPGGGPIIKKEGRIKGMRTNWVNKTGGGSGKVLDRTTSSGKSYKTRRARNKGG